MKRIPVLLVAGFLGAGKTTLLNNLLRTRSGLRIGVVVNDFGSVNIDAMLVAGQVDGAVALGNGCMCCTVDDDGLDATFEALTAPKAGLDLIVVEASGLAEPRNLIRMIVGSTNSRVEYGGLVYLVDTANHAGTRAQHARIDQHLALADLIVLNKVDLAGPEVIAAAREVARSRNPTAPIIETRDSAVDVVLLTGMEPRRVPDDGPRQLGLDELLIEDDAHCGHLHHDYQAVTFTEPGPMDPRALAAFLEQPPTGVFRIKGFVHFDVVGHRRKYLVHTVGNYVSVHAQKWEPGESRRTELVIIGAGIDEAQVLSGLGGCRAAGDVDEQSMLGITRYQR